MKKGYIKMEKDRRKAVTLLSLVITVIVLIVLAGITISLTIGEQGIFKHGQEAKVKQEIAQYIDKIELARGEATIEKLGRVTLDDLIKKIQEKIYMKAKNIKLFFIVDY